MAVQLCILYIGTNKKEFDIGSGYPRAVGTCHGHDFRYDDNRNIEQKHIRKKTLNVVRILFLRIT